MTGIGWQEPSDRAGALQHRHLAEGIPFVLVDFLTVLGNLTADILTPVLHAELSKVAPGKSRLHRKASRAKARNREGDGEDGES